MDTGEGPHLSRDEKRRVLEIYVDEVGGRVPVLAGIGGPYTAMACELARDAERAGASGIVVFPIPAFAGEPLSPDVPYEYHRAIADACGLPMVLFQLQPALAGVLFSRETLLRLIEIPTVIAIKEASFDAVKFVDTRRILHEAPRRITFLTGNDNFILESFVLGCTGALIGFGTIAIAEQVEMFRRVAAGDIAGAQDINDTVVQPLADALFAPPVRNYRARMKEALRQLGVIENTTMRPPLLPLAEADVAAMTSAMSRISLKSGTRAAASPV
jgi:4-hydroxy-tetrahydrodipicolinate synthase